jgi:glycosyltransferase involved in cell wall biosynthesis
MNTVSEPVVSVVTPVYNGARYLAECIESVLAQTHRNWEYIIVDNCSTDSTPEIASQYAQRDHRIRIVTNEHFVGVIENHNIAFSLISGESKYCKVLAADDYLLPECIQKLVDMAERNPRAAIVESYAISDNGVPWIGLPPHRSVFEGREVCRLYLLGAIEAFGTPSSVLYRSTAVRERRDFYPGPLPNADLAACLICLESADYAFVHQILSYRRIHSEAISADVHALDGFLTDRLQFVCEYGPTYLRSDEISSRREELLRTIYRYFALGVVHMRGKEYWSYHRGRLKAFGEQISGVRIAAAVCTKVADLVFNPKQTIGKLLRHLAKPRSPFGRRTDKDCFSPENTIHGTGV